MEDQEKPQGPQEATDEEIRKHIATEMTRRRGKGRMSNKEKLENDQMGQAIIQAMHERNEAKFTAMLRKSGAKDGDVKWVNAWKVFREYSG